MSLFNKTLIALDESITKNLTSFCWFTEKHFNIHNVFWAKFTFLIIGPISIFLFKILYGTGFDIEDLMFDAVKSFVMYFLVLFFTEKYFPYFKEVTQNARISPNKNRRHFIMYSAKISLFIILPFLYFFYKIFYPSFIDSEQYIVFVDLELLLYFLCTEPLPPKLKKEKSSLNFSFT